MSTIGPISALSLNRYNLHQAHHTETVSDEESEDGQIEIQCLEWKNKARLNISHQFLEGNANCYRSERRNGILTCIVL